MKAYLVPAVLFVYFFGVINCYSDCGSEVGSIVAVNIAGCDNVNRCILKRGTNASIEIEFQSNVDSDVVTAIVHGVVLTIPMPFNLPNPNGCKDSDIVCPIKTGQKYKYATSLPVLQEYPKVTVDVKWELQDKNLKDIVCVLIPAKLQ